MADFDFSTHYKYAAILLFPLALCGFACNLVVVFFLRVIPSLNNSFGILTLSQAVADCAHQAIFAFYFAPCIFLRTDQLYLLSDEFGFVIIIVYDICGLSHVCISINRCAAVYAPFVYSNMFSIRNTRIIIGCIWIIATITTTCMLIMIDCDVYLPHGTWIFTFKSTKICQKMQWLEFLKCTTYVSIVAILDCCSIMKIRYINVLNRSVSQDTASALLRKRERILVYQATLQGIFFISELITYFILSAYARNKWEAFLLTTISWSFVHGMDGFIVLICNRELRRKITIIFTTCSRSNEQQSNELRVSVKTPFNNLELNLN